jgi:2-C-methyl-D-erythritol 4-phosphate cytidylyltransferase
VSTTSSGPRAAVVLLAAGAGRRVGADANKVLLPLAGMPVFGWSLRWVDRLEYVDQVVVVVREQDRLTVERTIADRFPQLDVGIVLGGSSRHGSEWNALQALAPAIEGGRLDVVAVHDAARPLAGEPLFRRVLEVAAAHGGALPVREQRALLRRDGSLPAVRHGTGLVGVQTPQAFHAAALLDAYRRADRDGFVGTDTASCVAEYTDVDIRAVHCDATNLKVTFPEDVAAAERLVKTLPASPPAPRPER